MQELVEFANAEPFLVTGFIASGLAVLFYELKLKSQNIGALNTSMAVRFINNGGAVVDVRNAEQFAGGHLIDARNIPEAELSKDSGGLTKNKKGTLLVCDTGVRSSACAARLRKEGVDNVFSMKGGVQAWQQENLPLISDKGKAS
jgi:rhodanese-related sulfurtransferase